MAEPNPSDRPGSPSTQDGGQSGAQPGDRAATAGSESPGGYRTLNGFEVMTEHRPPGLVRRLLTTQRHLIGLLFGALIAAVRDRPPERRRGLRFRLMQLARLPLIPLTKRTLRRQPFPVQLRRRLELLGPTYIKLGQILALRHDVLPRPVTAELENLLDRLPVVPFERYRELVAEGLGRPVEKMFRFVDPQPLGSASIAQIHRAVTVEGDDVILKVVKPGIRELLRVDSVLLKGVGATLQLFFARFQPRRVIAEFVWYTRREADLLLEADNAETFAANFRDQPNIVFPKIYRRYSSHTVLTMQYLSGFKPSSRSALALGAAERDKVVDLGAEAIIRMIYRDGFFHADLHPGNLLILPNHAGSGIKAGFIDLGMVGRFDEELRRSLLFYYYCLVLGDTETAARYLCAVAQPGPGADPHGFRRFVEDVSRRWRLTANFADFSLAQLIMESVGGAGQYRMYFPVEMVLMVKALVTFEGVGQLLQPGLDVAAASRSHIQRIVLEQLSPLKLARETLRSGPELIDALAKAPLLVTEGLRVLEQSTRQPQENPFAGIRGTVLAGFCFLTAAILAGNQQWWIAGAVGLVGLVLALRRGG